MQNLVINFRNQEHYFKLQPCRVQGSRPCDGSFKRPGQRDEGPGLCLDRRQVQDLERGSVHLDRGQASGSDDVGRRRHRRGETADPLSG